MTRFPSDLVLAYDMERFIGNRMFDFSREANHGIVTGTRSVRGQFGRAREFGGSTDVITVANAPSLNPTGAITLSAWIEADVTDSLRGIIEKIQVGSGWVLRIDAGDLTFQMTTGGVLTQIGVAFSTGVMTHVAATYDGTTIRLYTDGTQVASGPKTGAITTNTVDLQIGRDRFGTSFDGIIDEPLIFSRALSDARISQLSKLKSAIHQILLWDWD